MSFSAFRFIVSSSLNIFWSIPRRPAYSTGKKSDGLFCAKGGGWYVCVCGWVWSVCPHRKSDRAKPRCIQTKATPTCRRLQWSSWQCSVGCRPGTVWPPASLPSLRGDPTKSGRGRGGGRNYRLPWLCCGRKEDGKRLPWLCYTCVTENYTNG